MTTRTNKAFDHFSNYWTLDTSVYEACCGIGVITQFPGDNDNTKENFISDEKLFKQGMVLRLKEIVSSDLDKGQYQAVINQYQKKFCHESLTKAGFKVIKSFKNPESGNTLYLYTVQVNQPRKTKRRERSEQKKAKRKF